MSAMLEPGQVYAARFDLVRPLAAGHGGGTWLARDREDGREVVLRFRVAADHAGDRLLAAVRHPSLLAPIRCIDGEDGPVDVFEYLPGGEIGKLRGRPWPLLVRRLLPVVDALSQVHAAGWVHGDVKTSNVLLDADGLAHLVDLGSARPIGATDASGGSPYSTSPERLDGAPAAAADDIYAFGVLLYELIGGHPPFYPDVTPQRVREEVPTPVAGRPAPPEPLRALIARCLAKDVAARPASMNELRSELERCLSLEDESPATAPAASPWTPRPPSDALPIRPQWQRTATATHTPEQLRREGFRKGLLAAAAVLALVAVAFTFFVLPGLVAPRATVSAPKTAAAPAPANTVAGPVEVTAANLEQLAELKKRAEEKRAPLPGRIEHLEQRDVAQWGKEGYAQVKSDLAAGDRAMTEREFAAALQRFDVVAQGLAGLEKRLPEVVKERLDAAKAAFTAGRSAEAAAGYTAALKADPENAAARTGLARSKVLDDVLRETNAGARAEQAGDNAAAIAAYERALKLDPATTVAHDSLVRLQARVAGDAYAAVIAQAQAALARNDFAAAQAAYERAAKLRPGAPEIAEGLQQIKRATETRQLASTLERALAAEHAEHWSEALNLHREALKGDPTLRTAQDGVERTEPRAMLDAELQSFLDKPDRFFSAPGRDIARNVVERASKIPAPGPRLQSQITRMQESLRQAETPIRVALASDNATDVQIYRVGKLGLFDHRDLELMPGRYTVVGTRQGYRDVRKELNVLPGAPPPELVVRCEEPI
jgi:tetratricopeptide (TPR) repeat protein